jgi:acyl-CoA synthetase (AMP-forming)/AMP-acid ligase II
MTSDWSLPAAIDAVAAAVPDREMLVWTSVRRTYAEVQERTKRLGAFFGAHGLGVRRERSDLARWECGQSPVAILVSNCPEYVETMLGAYRARAVPFNVNHHYNAAEVAALLDQIGAEAVVYHRRLAPLLAEVRPSTDRLLVHLDDGTDAEPRPGSIALESAIASGGDLDGLPTPSPDDLYLVCTGGTTGRPKGVQWRQGDVYVAAMGGAEGATAETIAATAAQAAQVWFAAPPLMHGAAQWTVFAALHNGRTVVLHDDAAPFDARTILETAEREHASLLTIVGDAYARPMVDELRTRRYDLSSLQQLATGGAMTGPANKRALLELLPHVTIVDGYGASETGGMAFGVSRKDAQTQQFQPSFGAAVLSADRARFLEPGDDEIGWIARIGRVPLAYLNDPERTEQTFPIVEGRRLSVPGDRGILAADGTIVLLGRDSMVVNSGGEKIFVEEVEEAIRRHPDVLDALVVGRPSDRFGEEVVALVQLRPDADMTGADIREYAGEKVARFKAPRAVLLCDHIARHPSGKADYAWARQAALDAVTVAR